MEIRNIAIIAHVDHGKTTLTDNMLEQCGMREEGASMDSNALEQERGITIYAKNTSVFYTDKNGNKTKINIVDTPGHADFGSEVERVLRSIDSVLLIVDAQEGPMPQTRFVLKKSLELGLKPILVLNKIDKPGADVKKAHDDVFELFMELGATDEQLDFTTVYAIGRNGTAKRNMEDEMVDLKPLFETILEKVPPAANDTSKPFRMQSFNLAYDSFLGRLGIGRVYEGIVKNGQSVTVINPITGARRPGKITKLCTFEGTKRVEVEQAIAGDVVMIAGISDIFIGETVATNADAEPLPAITVDEPTIKLDFLVNNSPFAGREGKFVTTRQIRERLEKELEINVGLRVDFNPDPDRALEGFKVFGRGEMHIAVLLENMRREGFEIQVSQPQAIIKEIDGVKSEPFEEVTIDSPSEFQGAIIEKLGKRAFIMKDMKIHENTVRMVFEGPTRGLFGYRGIFMIDTKGEGIIASRFLEFRPYAGAIEKRATGSMTSMESGKALGFALGNLQDRGQLYIGPQTEVYEGMVVGNTAKGDEMVVNPTKGKQLTNMRASGTDETILLIPPIQITIERGLEIMSNDEFLEITPKSTRIRKQYLKESERSKNKRKED